MRKLVVYPVVFCLLLGFILSSCEKTSSTAEEIDIKAGWTELSSFNSSYTTTGSFVFVSQNSGHAYIGAGWTDIGYGREVWDYNIFSGTFEAKRPFPGKGLYRSSAFAYGNLGYVVGGSAFYPENGIDSLTSEVWRYDMAKDTFTRIDDFPGGKIYGASSFVLNSKAYIVGGKDSAGFRNSVWMFDFNTETWTKKDDFPGKPRWGAATFVLGGNGYVTMGEGDEHVTYSDTYCYVVKDDQWVKKASFPESGREGAMSFTSGGVAYIACGWSQGKTTNTVYKYLENNKWVSYGTYPGTTRVHGVAFSYGGRAITGLGYGSRDMWSFYLPDASSK